MSTAVRSPRKKAAAENNGEEASGTPYRLRNASRLPSRYRDDEVFISPARAKKAHGNGVTPKKSPMKRPSSSPRNSPIYNNTPANAKLTLLAKTVLEHASASSSPSSSMLGDFREERRPARRVINLSPDRVQTSDIVRSEDIVVGTEEEVEEEEEEDEEEEENEDEEKRRAHAEWLDMQSFFDLFNKGYERDAMIERFAGFSTKSKTHMGTLRIMRANLKRLNNILKYKKARQWIICEFFYSGIDDQIFNGENEFDTIIKESFPFLKTRMLNRVEWRTIRRLLGKPRRCSSAFFAEERMYLEEKRLRIRSVYEGSYLNDPNIDLKDLPARLPKPLIVGSRVFARVRQPRDGIYAGIIDALVPNGYRICFDKFQGELAPTLVRDTEVLAEGPQDLLSIAYFIEQANSKLPTGVRPFVSAVRDATRPNLLKDELVSRGGCSGDKGPLDGPNDARLSGRSAEMVGNFPLRFLVNLVKLTKLIEIKKGLVRQLTELNGEAERNNLTTSKYSMAFKEKYAKVVVDLEHVNQNIESNMNGIQDHNMYFTSSNESMRPDTMRKVCYQRAGRFVEHCNQGLNVENVHALQLIQSLTSSLIQVRELGKIKVSAQDLLSLSESIVAIKNMVSPNNQTFFEDNVEVHMKHFQNLLVENGALSGVPTRR